MATMSFDKVSFFYDFIEKYILKDYQGSLDLFNKYLTLDKSCKVVDVGGGTGFFSQAIIEKVDDTVVIDSSIKMLLKIKNKNISVVQGDGSFLSVKDETFDLALLVNVLHHIHKNNQKEVLTEVYRVLKKQGKVFIIEACFPKTFFNKLFLTLEKITVGKTYHIPTEELKIHLDDAGFRNIEMTYPKEHSWKYVAVALR